MFDRSTRNRPRDASGTPIFPDKGSMRTDSYDGKTFYLSLPWGQLRAYVKHQLSGKTFCNIKDQEVRKALLARARQVLRLELEVDVASFRYGAAGEEIFPVNPARWCSADMTLDPFEIVWTEFRRLGALDASLAKHCPVQKPQALPEDYWQVVLASLRGQDVLLHPSILLDRKKLSRVAKRVREELKVDLYLPWHIQRRETRSRALGDLLQYQQRCRAPNSGFGDISLTKQNVHLLLELLLKLIG